MTPNQLPPLLTYTLTKSTRRLTFDILQQDDRVTYRDDDDGPYFKFTASNGYEVISRSRMDIQTERIWLLGAKSGDEQRSGTMIFSSDAKRDTAYTQFILALDEWAVANGGRALQALAQVQGEPVWFHKNWGEYDDIFYRPNDVIPDGSTPLYTTPQPQPAPVDALPDLNPEDIVVDVVLKQLGGFAPVTTHGVRVTHKPSLVSVMVDSERSQHRNRQLALEALRVIIHHQAHPVPSPVDELVEALEGLMDWQVKNVKVWHNRAYDNAHRWLEKHRAALQSPAPQATKGGEA